MSENILPAVYPRLIRRIQACIIDSVIFSFISVVFFLSVAALEVEPVGVRIVIVLLPVLFFEPVLVSYTGGTIGHHLLKLKVQDVSRNENINIFLAFIRFILKYFLGAVLLIFILATRKHQAIHDFIAGSVVIHNNPNHVPAYEALVEREIEEEGYIYPSKLRRISVIILYNILLSILTGVVLDFLVSEECIENNMCSPSENIIFYVFGIIWLVSAALILAGGWKGLILGCRRKKIKTAEII